MSKLTVLGSSSKGNGYLLECRGQTLIIEAGLSYEKIVLPAINWQHYRVVGCLISHRHGDHAKYVNEYNLRRVLIYGNPDIESVFPLATKSKYSIGHFKVQCLEVNHNVPCYSYIIDCPDDVRVLFITDTSGFKYRVKGVHCLMVEANYSEDVILDHAVQDQWSRSASENHLSIDQAIEVIKRHDTVDLQDIILLHLSDGNSDESMFKKMVKEETGHDCYIADKGLVIELKNSEF